MNQPITFSFSTGYITMSVKVALSGWNIRPAELNKRSIGTFDGSRKNDDYSCKFTTH